MIQIPAAQFLVASLVAGILGISGMFLGTSVSTAPVTVSLEPTRGTPTVGETFVVTLTLTSSIPVNAFRGLLEFDASKLSVAAIDYNTSIATLWAEEPWYSNGDGTINFTGGSTLQGGFQGSGTLITITFNTTNSGQASISIADMQVLQHDGAGTEAALSTPLDALFSVAPAHTITDVLAGVSKNSKITVLQESMNKDLNNDGKQSIADISIFMTDLLSGNKRSDFNQDGVVNLSDLSILTTES